MFKFPNGYGASLINDGYGCDRGLFEIAVIAFDGDEWNLTYDTSVTNDVLGYLSVTEVDEKLMEIFNLANKE